MIAIPRIPAAPWRLPNAVVPGTFADIEEAFGRALVRKHIEATVAPLIAALRGEPALPPLSGHRTGYPHGAARGVGDSVKAMLAKGASLSSIVRDLNVSSATVVHHRRKLAEERAKTP